MGGQEEEDGNAHKRVRAVRRKGRWEKIKSGDEKKTQGRRVEGGEKARE